MACEGVSSDPIIDCGFWVGSNYIDVQPEPLGYLFQYEINVRDSIQISATVRRVDASTAGFNPQLGWYCYTSASSPVSGAVGLSTTDTDIVRLGSDGWIHGLSFGTATITASSTQPALTTEFGVFVYAP